MLSLGAGTATVERRLPGVPLRVTMDADARWVSDSAVDAVVTTLAALGAAPVSPALR